MVIHRYVPYSMKMHDCSKCQKKTLHTICRELRDKKWYRVLTCLFCEAEEALEA